MSDSSNKSGICPVILSGGIGSRLWPLSREGCPKQFQPLVSDLSMLQATALRVSDPRIYAAPIVVSSRGLAELTTRHLGEVGISGHLILEPIGRGTAPAVALAALDLAERESADSMVLVLPTDHHIQDTAAFEAAVGTAAALARSGYLVALGIEPSAPATGYGYIRRGLPIAEAGGSAFLIDSFHEKPDLPTARSYVSSGDCFWNAGIFLFRVADYLDELGRLWPGIIAACRDALRAGAAEAGAIVADENLYRGCPSGSVDVLLMERTRRGAVVPAAMKWSDVGSWDALWHASAKDPAGNVAAGDVLTLDSSNCYVRAEEGATLALIGLEDIVAVAVGTTILVAHRDAADRVREVYAALMARAGDR